MIKLKFQIEYPTLDFLFKLHVNGRVKDSHHFIIVEKKALVSAEKYQKLYGKFGNIHKIANGCKNFGKYALDLDRSEWMCVCVCSASVFRGDENLSDVWHLHGLKCHIFFFLLCLLFVGS